MQSGTGTESAVGLPESNHGGDQFAIAHEAALDGLKTNSDKINEEKHKKMAKLKQFTLTNKQPKANHCDTNEAGKKKGGSSPKTSSNSSTTDEVQATLREVMVRLDTCENKTRQVEQRHRDLDSKCEKQRKCMEAAIVDKCDALAVAINIEEESRVHLGQELQQMLRSIEQQLRQTITREVEDEATSRNLVSADVSKLTDNFHDLKGQLETEVSKLQAKITSWSLKVKGQLSDASDQLHGERAMRECAEAACKNELEQKLQELKVSFEAKVMETDLEHDARLHRMNVDVNLMQQHLDTVKAQAQDLVEDLEKKHTKKISDTDVNLTAKIEQIIQQLEDKCQESAVRHIELKGDIKQENAERKRSLNVLQQELAQEHLRREQDESAIINMLDTFMRQMKDINSVR